MSLIRIQNWSLEANALNFSWTCRTATLWRFTRSRLEVVKQRMALFARSRRYLITEARHYWGWHVGSVQRGKPYAFKPGQDFSDQ